MVTPNNKPASSDRLITFPIFLLLIYNVCTFFPVIYIHIPFLGKIRIVLLVGIALVISYVLSSGNYTNSKVYRNPILFSWVGFLATMVMSLIVSYDRGLTLTIIEKNVKYFIVFLIMIKIIDSDKRLDLLLGIFAACGVGMAIITNLNFLVFGKTFEEGYRAMAIEAGTFGDPNDLAMLFNVTLALLLYFLIAKRKKLITIIGIITTITAIMFTYSRGGFVGLCTVGLSFLLLIGRRKKIYIFLVLIVAVLFWSLAPEKYKERISTIEEEAQIDEETGKYIGRIEAWKYVVKEGWNRPILGTGAGCSYYIAGMGMEDWHFVHNSFIQVFAEMGILGLGPFVLLFILPYRQYCGFRKQSTEELGGHLERYRFVLLSLAAFTTTAFFLPQSYSAILYFLTGLALVQAELASRFKESLELRRSKQI